MREADGGEGSGPAKVEVEENYRRIGSGQHQLLPASAAENEEGTAGDNHDWLAVAEESPSTELGANDGD